MKETYSITKPSFPQSRGEFIPESALVTIQEGAFVGEFQQYIPILPNEYYSNTASQGTPAN
jgi:hypothetical protein